MARKPAGSAVGKDTNTPRPLTGQEYDTALAEILAWSCATGPEPISPGEHAAWHEAGHAVASVLLGCEFVGVDLHTHHRPTLATILGVEPSDVAAAKLAILAQRERVGRQIVVALVGPAAEMCYTPSPAMFGGASDFQFAGALMSLLADAAGTDWNAYATELEDQADTLIEEHWGAIDRVARALLEKEGLTAEEVRALIEMPQPGVSR